MNPLRQIAHLSATGDYEKALRLMRDYRRHPDTELCMVVLLQPYEAFLDREAQKARPDFITAWFRKFGKTEGLK